MVSISRISLFLFVGLMVLGINCEKPKTVTRVLYMSILLYIIFIICSIWIHPFIGVINCILAVILLIMMMSSPDNLSANFVYYLYGIGLIWGITVIITIIESVIGRALF